ncbi:MAG: hypothetical protein ACRCZ9_04350 [Fusobacteriaceae bacterium]
MRYIIKEQAKVPTVKNLEDIIKKIEDFKNIEGLKDPINFIKPAEIQSFVYPDLYKESEYSHVYNWSQLRSICEKWYRLDENEFFGKYPAIAWVYYFNGDIDTQNKIMEYALFMLKFNSIESDML